MFQAVPCICLPRFGDASGGVVLALPVGLRLGRHTLTAIPFAGAMLITCLLRRLNPEVFATVLIAALADGRLPVCQHERSEQPLCFSSRRRNGKVLMLYRPHTHSHPLQVSLAAARDRWIF